MPVAPRSDGAQALIGEVVYMRQRRVSEVCASGRGKNHNLAFQLFYALSMGRQLGAGPQSRR